MSRDFRPLLITAAALVAGVSGTMSAAGEDTTLVGSATGVTFSGFDKGAEGRRLWTLSADRAAPAPGGKKGVDWAMERVRIRTFEKMTGRELAVISAPNARYEGEAKVAHDSGPVSVEGRGVRLAGRDWKWVDASGTDTVDIASDVRVTIHRTDESGKAAPPIVITARSLHATMEQTGMHLALEGAVRIVQEDMVVTCQTLTTRVRGGPGELGGRKGGTDAVERIDGEGGVRLERKGDVITGKRAEIFPAKRLCSVIGDAEFTHLGDNRLKVNGEAMRYDRLSRRITVEPRADAEDGRVTAELPALDAARAKDSSQQDARSYASGRNLEILTRPEGNILLLNGDVRIRDTDYTGTCEKLTVETTTKETTFVQAAPKTDSVKRIIAEESVTLTRDGRTARCGRAEIIPAKNSVTLTQSPRADDTTQGASVEADRVTIDTVTQRLVATSTPEKPVVVKLPPLKGGLPARGGALAKSAGPGTTVESRILVLSRKGDTGVFEFEDKVKLSGDGLDGACDRLGVEVETRAGARTADHRVRRIVAVGDARLSQAAYRAEAGRAEIIPGAKLKELTVADDNGMDGHSPFFITLSRDDSSPGLRPKVTMPEIGAPRLGLDGVSETPKTATKTESEPSVETTITADHMELINGAERLRAFARGDVVLAGKELAGTAASAELLATANPEKGSGKPDFIVDTLVARGGVQVKFGDRAAKAQTLEIFPAKNTLALSGAPSIDGWRSAPGVERKTIVWSQEPGPDGKPHTALHIADEQRAGMPKQIIRPTLVLPAESAPDLGRSLKNFDKGE